MLFLVIQSYPTLWNPIDYSLPSSSVHGDLPDKNTGMGCHVLLQGIFPTQGSNPGLLHCGWILYQLSHQGSPRILGWVAYPIFKGTFPLRNWTGVSCFWGRFFTGLGTWKVHTTLTYHIKTCIAKNWLSSKKLFCFLWMPHWNSGIQLKKWLLHLCFKYIKIFLKLKWISPKG